MRRLSILAATLALAGALPATADPVDVVVIRRPPPRRSDSTCHVSPGMAFDLRTVRYYVTVAIESSDPSAVIRADCAILDRETGKEYGVVTAWYPANPTDTKPVDVPFGSSPGICLTVTDDGGVTRQCTW